MALNLSKIGDIAERYMVDTITITRATGDTSELHPITLEVLRDQTTVYNGKALVSPQGNSYRTGREGQEYADLTYEVMIPLGAEVIKPEDVITVTVSPNDAANLGTMKVLGIMPATLSAVRRILCRREVAVQ